VLAVHAQPSKVFCAACPCALTDVNGGDEECKPKIAGEARAACNRPPPHAYRGIALVPTPCARSSSAGWRRRRVRCGRAASGHAETTLGRGTRVKWMLVVIVLGSTPVQTDLVFDTLDQCYRAEQQMRIEYTKAFDEWLKWAVQNPTESDYPKSREFMMQRLMSGVCVPHSGLPNSN
jgi:hypothetical protein